MKVLKKQGRKSCRSDQEMGCHDCTSKLKTVEIITTNQTEKRRVPWNFVFPKFERLLYFGQVICRADFTVACYTICSLVLSSWWLVLHDKVMNNAILFFYRAFSLWPATTRRINYGNNDFPCHQSCEKVQPYI